MTTTKEVVRIGPFKDFIPSGVRVGDLITLSGQVSVNQEGQVVGEGDLAAQLTQVYANTREVLGRFGASMGNIVDEMWLVTDVQDAMVNVERLFKIRSDALGGNADVTQTMMQVAGLFMSELLIEVKCIARL